ncbi:MAG TPA: DUF6701 domain-containing protein [Burkholderiales bacterium]|nr:DUF6701 domain-containing protein [Burkholderiales bacterium]
MVNATRTSGCALLWRWARRIARALLVMGALAGMTLGAVAHAQVGFRSAASSTALAPQFRSATSGTLTTVAFRSASSGFLVGTGTLSVPRPAGMAVNDVLIIAVAVRPIASTITPLQAGWTLIRRTDNAVANANSLAIYYKVITNLASEPAANYTFTIGGGATHATGGIQAFSGVDNTNPIDVENGQTTPNATNHSTPNITTTVRNTVVAAMFSVASADAWAPVTAGLTERFDVSSPTPGSNAVGQTTEGATRTQAARGAVGVQTSALTGAFNDVGNAHILAVRPALRINLPAGVLANDVLIASIGITPSTAVITPPAGWTLVRRDNQAVATANSLAIYQKIATGAEPAFYDFTVATTDFAVGGIQAFFNVDTTTPVNVQAGNATASASTHTAPTVTPTVPNTLLVTSHTYAASQNWTPPAGMTESFDIRSGAAAAAGQAVEGNFQYIAAGGAATGTRTATAAGATPDTGNANSLALQSPRPRLTINVPAGTALNDQMIAAISVQPSTATVTPPAGWTLVRQINNAAATSNSLYVYRRTATGAEPASYTWDFAAWASGYAAGGIESFSGVDTTTPIDVENGAATASALTHATPSVTTTVANTMLVTSHAIASSSTWTAPAGMAEAFETAALTTPNVNGQSIEGNYVAQVAIGATGAKTATASANADAGNAHILALRPAPPPPPAAGGFNAYESSTIAGAITGVIKTKIAGSAISLDMIVLNAAETAILTTFTGTVRVEVLDASNNSGALDGNSCRPTWTVIQTLSPDPAFIAGDNGRKTISFTQPNSYPNTRLRITFPAGAPTVTGCSTDNFAIRPNALASFAVTDTDWQTAGTGRALNLLTFAAITPTHKAGRPFSVRATAVNGAAATTTNYVGAPTATLATCVGAACTATFGTLTLATTFVAGQLVNDVASYNNVGSFRLELVDSSFASVDAGDSSPLEREIRSGTIDIGRFVPDHFAVALNAPNFGTACAAGTFTYVGETFNYNTLQPIITVTAQDFANNPTTLYAGAWLRITNSSVTPATQAARYSRFDALGGGTTPTLNYAGLPATAGDPAIGVFTAGVGTLTFSSGTGLGFVRSTTTPNAPFNADIALALNVIDTDGVAFAGNPAAFGTATLGGGMAFSSGKQMRFGRMRLMNVFGSALLDLPLSLTTEYYDGSFFVTNTADSCTTLAASNIVFNFVGPNLAACETFLNPAGALAFTSGKANVKLTKPGSNKNGAVDLTVNLGTVPAGNTCTSATSSAATAANKIWLQGNWGGGAYDQNPQGRATFGIFKNADQFLYFREIH